MQSALDLKPNSDHQLQYIVKIDNEVKRVMTDAPTDCLNNVAESNVVLNSYGISTACEAVNLKNAALYLRT